MIVESSLTERDMLSEKQIKMIEEAKNKPVVYDEDSPEMTPEMEKAFRLAARTRNRMKTV